MKKLGLFLMAMVLTVVAFAQDTLPLSEALDTLIAVISGAVVTIPEKGSPLTDYLTWGFGLASLLVGVWIFLREKVIIGLRKKIKKDSGA